MKCRRQKYPVLKRVLGIEGSSEAVETTAVANAAGIAAGTVAERKVPRFRRRKDVLRIPLDAAVLLSFEEVLAFCQWLQPSQDRCK